MNKIEAHLMAITSYRDCIKQRMRKGCCYECPIPVSGVPTPLDLCDLSVDEAEQKIDEHLDKIWKMYHNKEITVVSKMEGKTDKLSQEGS